MSVSKFAEGFTRPIRLTGAPSAAAYFTAAALNVDPVFQLGIAAIAPLFFIDRHQKTEEYTMFDRGRKSKNLGLWFGRVATGGGILAMLGHFVKNNPNFVGDTLNYARSFV